MNECIVIRLKPSEPVQIYIFTDAEERTPITWDATIDNLNQKVNEAIKKFNIHSIKLTGVKSYAEHFIEGLRQSISTQFDLATTDISLLTSVKY